MAELVALKLAAPVVAGAVIRISEIVANESASLRGVRGDILSLQKELKWIESFLRDANKKQEKDERVRMWITEVRDVAFEIEDALETYVSKVGSSSLKGIHLRRLRALRAQVRSIQERLRNIGERRQRYQIELPDGDREPAPLRNERRTHPGKEEDNAVNLKSTMKDLIAQLVSEEDRRCVVSVVGMGGLGKTTLVKNAYNDPGVKKKFGCSAWVFVSQQCVAREVLIEILMQVGFPPDTALSGMSQAMQLVEGRRSNRQRLNEFEDHELASLLKNELEEKRYLVVLDDILDVQAWNSIEQSFPKGKRGSKVVFTTRIREVAVMADPHSSPIEPPLLTEEQGWELLQRKALPKEIFGSQGSPPEFVELGKEMVAECGGLPLAVVMLGALLRTKNSPEKWEKVKRDAKSRKINKLRSERQYRVEDILDLSFQELPVHLKPCLLYLASFPEDSEMPSNILIRMWMAEGFILTDGAVEEEMGEEYLEELVDRCVVQLDKRDHTGKRVKSCRLHDLMRDFCLSKAKDVRFLEMDDSSPSSSSTQRSRRVAVHGPDRQFSPHRHLCSLFCFSIRTAPVFSCVRLLRVLHLNFLGIPILPLMIGGLIHLRYLRLRGNGGRNLSVPRSLGRLRNLQNLDLSGIRGLLMLRTSVWKLTQLKLRHLMLPWRYHLNFSVLWLPFLGQTEFKLETLKGIHAENLFNNRNSIPTMENIKVLGIKNLGSHKQVTLLLESLIPQLLRSLTMELSNLDTDFPTMESLSSFRGLSKLSLSGGVSSRSLGSLPCSLVKLTLHRTVLDQSKIAILEKLQNLRFLNLFSSWLKPRSAYQKWVLSSDGFARLEALELCNIVNLHQWEVKEGALRSLKRLHISSMRNLIALPEGLRHVTSLQEITINAMTKEFQHKIRRVNPDGVHLIIPRFSLIITFQLEHLQYIALIL